jgi:hypothetical protein
MENENLRSGSFTTKAGNIPMMLSVIMSHTRICSLKSKSCLDVDKLRAFGSTKACMNDCNALLVLVLPTALPIGNPKRSGVKGDAQMPYYTDITGFTNIYGASKLGMAGTYGHKFKPSSCSLSLINSLPKTSLYIV